MRISRGFWGKFLISDKIFVILLHRFANVAEPVGWDYEVQIAFAHHHLAMEAAAVLPMIGERYWTGLHKPRPRGPGIATGSSKPLAAGRPLSWPAFTCTGRVTNRAGTSSHGGGRPDKVSPPS